MRPDANQRPGPAASQHGPHLLSFDVEEYFQVEAAAPRVRREEWPTFEKRLTPSLERILELLAERQASATFFVLGWVGRREPELLRRIAQAGHEIASHGMEHRMLQYLTPDAFRRDVVDGRHLLEDVSGESVVGYRAPTFSITHETAWALDVLAETGFRYDSSVFPICHDRYGVPDAPAHLHRAVGPGGGSILEIPPLTLRLAGRNWPVGGGGYLRLLPKCIVAHALEVAQRRGQRGMIYLHPWELDPEQPVLPMSRLSRLRHRLGLRKTDAKLRWLLGRFRFIGVRQILDTLADDLQEYTYGVLGR